MPLSIIWINYFIIFKDLLIEEIVRKHIMYMRIPKKCWPHYLSDICSYKYRNPVFWLLFSGLDLVLLHGINNKNVLDKIPSMIRAAGTYLQIGTWGTAIPPILVILITLKVGADYALKICFSHQVFLHSDGPDDLYNLSKCTIGLHFLWKK